ncbi:MULTISPECIES: hypothetical protein [unclassified Serratia (in: enterobacteria)]|uniref:hypothetical protein n=1 Tax=unclassified Serratia (in: enterobacteria) TaxID=2647522 RepID=UPI0004FF8265|nr:MULTISPECIES: hypothetical protein [unclassified Serratia (in: enterobacteria)]KFK93711.1 hypothetical protein JV45_14975 [Serratia sp. Ag2]KFK98924.1 hypothetical protein IV04_09895 [Serratia sp. Ag1]
MISNDIILNVSSLFMLLFLLSWGACFFIFVYRRLDGPKVGRDSLIYFNFMFFKNDFLSNIALSFLFFGYMAAAAFEYRREFNDLILMANLAGGMSLFLFAIYGRCFYKGIIDDKKPFFFIKIFLTEFDLSFGSTFLWLSRLTYVTWLLMLIRG